MCQLRTRQRGGRESFFLLCVAMAMISKKTACVYTQELKRTPPAKANGVELTKSEILDREQKLAAYRKNLKRPISGKHIQAFQDVKAARVAAEGAKAAAEGAQAAAEEGTAASKDVLKEVREIARKLDGMEDKGAKVDELHEVMLGMEETEQRDFQTDEQYLKELERRMALMAQSRKELKEKVKQDERDKKAEQRQKEREQKAEEKKKAKEEEKKKAAEAKAQAKMKAKPKPKPSQQRGVKRNAPASLSVLPSGERQRKTYPPVPVAPEGGWPYAVCAPKNNLLKRYKEDPKTDMLEASESDDSSSSDDGD